jgi:DHA1 family tetracycline resistance protein-like MFS transporter
MIGLSLTAVGISMAFCQAIVIGRAVDRFGERRTAQYGMLFGIAGFTALAFLTNGLVVFLLFFVNGLQGIAMPALNAMMSRRVPPDQQGELQGFNGSMAALAFLLAQLIFNFTLAFFTSDAAPFRFPGAPFVIAAVFAAIALLTLTMLPKSKSLPDQS